MKTNTIDIKTKTAKSNSFPSANYFQVHFAYIHELIASLQLQLELSNQKVSALQQQLNEISIRDLDQTEHHH